MTKILAIEVNIRKGIQSEIYFGAAKEMRSAGGRTYHYTYIVIYVYNSFYLFIFMITNSKKEPNSFGYYANDKAWTFHAI